VVFAQDSAGDPWNLDAMAGLHDAANGTIRSARGHFCFRLVRARSICASTAVFSSPIASEISHTSSLLDLSRVRDSPGVKGLEFLNSVSALTTSARSSAEPAV